MAGPIRLNEDVIKPMTDIAFKDSNSNWHAGPDANGYEQGSFVPEEYAQKARKQRQHTNAVKQNMRKQDLSEKEARERVNKFKKELENEKDKAEPDPERIADIQRKLGGSG